MSKANLKYIFYLVGIIFLLFVLSVSVVLLIKNITNLDGSNVSEKDVVYLSDSNTVVIKNSLTVTDVFGKTITDDNGGSYGYLEFSVRNMVDEARDYQVYLIKNRVSGKELNSKYLRFYLTDGDNNAVGMFTENKLPSYVELNFISNKPNSKLLYSGSLEANEEKVFKLRVWVTSNYVILDEEEVFSFEIGVRAV